MQQTHNTQIPDTDRINSLAIELICMPEAL